MSQNRMSSVRGAVIGFLSLWFFMMPCVALAHGDDRTLIMAATPVGPYTATVWVAPGVMRPGEIHVDTLIFKPDGRALLTGQVRVDIVKTGHAAPHYSAPAIATAQTGITREAHFRIEQPGAYQVRITVQGESGVGSIAFPLEIVQIPLLVKGGIYLLWGVAGAATLLLLVHGLLIVRRVRPTFSGAF